MRCPNEFFYTIKTLRLQLVITFNLYILFKHSHTGTYFSTLPSSPLKPPTLDPTQVSTKATNNNQRTTYSVSEPSKFSVDSSGVVKMTQALSRDVPDGFAPQQVNVKADAGGYSPGYAVVTVPLEDINDNKPLLDPCCTSGFINENTGL